IAVADTFDALTTNRPYQHAHTPEEALKIIQNLAGKRLDPVAVKALLAVYERGEIRIQRFSIKRPVAVAAATAPAPVSSGSPTAVAEVAAETAELERTRVYLDLPCSINSLLPAMFSAACAANCIDPSLRKERFAQDDKVRELSALSPNRNTASIEPKFCPAIA